MPRLIYIATSAITVEKLMEAQLAWMCSRGFDVAVLSSPGSELEAVGARNDVRTVSVPLRREIHLSSDFAALVCLYRTMKKLRPDIVNAGTPKAGLLGMLAAWLAGVPVRIYTLRGLRLETVRGVKYFLLKLAERIACSCAHRVICVSESLRRRAIELGLACPSRTVVLASGSSTGVQVSGFIPTSERLKRAEQIRRDLGIPAKVPVLGFVGRFVRDKGIVELLEAFESLKTQFPEVRLLLLGVFEEGDPIPDSTRMKIESDPQIIWAGWIDDPSNYYQVMDIVVLPSYREGFPNVVLQAAAAERPVVGTRTTGIVDAIVDGQTGILVPVGQAKALADALRGLLRNQVRRIQMGRAGRQRVEQEFQSERLWAELEVLYREMLRGKGIPLPEGEEATPAAFEVSS